MPSPQVRLDFQSPSLPEDPLCGTACLRAVLSFYGLLVEESSLRRGPGATGPRELVEAARNLGFRASLRSLSLSEVKVLLRSRVPPILEMKGQWAVAVGYDDAEGSLELLSFSPGRGRAHVKYGELGEVWGSECGVLVFPP
jgi:ABC-type bacteriocin/lantibiotic exporter with double-glycine peptidase domain